jgi:hypothetical protein
MTTTHIFIPRILSNISKEFVVNTFYNMKIGNITYIDMHTRINEMGYRYSFAFITIELFDSDMAKYIMQKLNSHGNAQIPYEERYYWEIKLFIPKENRVKNVVYSTQESLSDPVNEAFILSDDEYDDDNDDQEEPSWLYDDKDDWNLDDDIQTAFDNDQLSEDETYEIIKMCDELLKTPEQREMERDFEDLNREIEKTVFVTNISVW